MAEVNIAAVVKSGPCVLTWFYVSEEEEFREGLFVANEERRRDI